MLVTLFGIVMLVMPLPAKAHSPMMVTLLGIVKEVSVFPAGYVCKTKVLPFPNNMPLSEIYALFPVATFIAVSFSQLEKAPPPMLVTLFGIVTLARLVQPEKVHCPMLVTLFGIVTLVRLVQPEKVHCPMLVILLGIVTLVRLVQPEKVHCPMLVMLLGIVTLVRLVQPEKAPPPMLVTLLGIVKEVSVFPAGYVCKTKVLPFSNNMPLSEIYELFPAATFIAVRLLQ